MKIEPEVNHNLEKQRFELHINGHQAVLNYMLHGNLITFTHTGVPSAIEGRGIGSKLVETGLNYARENGLRVRSTCWFVSKYIRHNPGYQDLLN
jgi:uncharacterized protein